MGRKGSKWSEKNKNLVKELEAKGEMTIMDTQKGKHGSLRY